MVERINQIPRADTQIANSEKMHLWDIKTNDELVINAEEEIKAILLDNLKVTDKAKNVFEEFRFLLEEESRLEKQLENPDPKRPDFIAEI